MSALRPHTLYTIHYTPYMYPSLYLTHTTLITTALPRHAYYTLQRNIVTILLLLSYNTTLHYYLITNTISLLLYYVIHTPLPLGAIPVRYPALPLRLPPPPCFILNRYGIFNNIYFFYAFIG
jgi:hypothetical protein